MSFQTHHRGTKYHLGGSSSPSSPSTHSPNSGSLFTANITTPNSSSPIVFNSSYSADSLEEGRHEFSNNINSSSTSNPTTTTSSKNYTYTNPKLPKNQQQQKRFLVNILICLAIVIVTFVLGYLVYSKLFNSNNGAKLKGYGRENNDPTRYTNNNDQALERVRSRENKSKNLKYTSEDDEQNETYDSKRAEQRRTPRRGSKEENDVIREGESKTTIVHEDYTTYSSPTEKFMWRGMFGERMVTLSDCPVPFRSKNGKLLKKVANTIYTYLTQPIGSENYEEVINAEKITESENLQIDWASTLISTAPDCTSSALLNKRSDSEFLIFCENAKSEPFLALSRDSNGDGTATSPSAFVNIKEKKLDSLTFEPTKKVIKLSKDQIKDTEIIVAKCSKGSDKAKKTSRDIVTRVAFNPELKKAAEETYTKRVKKLEETDKTLKDQSKKPKHEYHQFAANIEYEYEMMHPVNILNIILDGTSRSNFIRELPRTVNVLEEIELDQKRTMFKKPSKHRVFQFFRYNTVGHSSRENIFALENGLKISPAFMKNYFEETSGNFEKDEPARQQKLLTETLIGAKEGDSSKLITHNIWNIAKQLGYVTMFTSSECPYIKVKDPNKKKLMDTSSHLFNAWHRADHNLLSLACEKHLFKSSNNRKCLGSKDLFEHMFDYTTDFFAKYPGTARFATIHFEESKHIRSRTLMNALDISLARFIVDITKEHPHTLIVLSSGNGISHGPFYVTDVGQKEHQLPLLNLVVPEHLQLRHKDIFTNLARNQQQLVTPFDLYASLAHFMLFPQVELPAHYSLIHHVSTEQEEKEEKDEYEALAKSILQPIHNPRFCKHAGVDPRWCSCNKYETLDFNTQPYSAIVSTIVKSAVSYVNKIVKPHKETCLPIESKSVLKASRITLQLPEESEGRTVSAYTSVLFTTQTDDVFEADYSMTSERTLDKLIAVRRVSLVEHHDESVRNRETVICDKVKGFETNPDLCICRQD